MTTVAVGESEAEGLKERGNALFSKGKYLEALECYEAAISKFPNCAIYYSNASACCAAWPCTEPVNGWVGSWSVSTAACANEQGSISINHHLATNKLLAATQGVELQLDTGLWILLNLIIQAAPVKIFR